MTKFLFNDGQCRQIREKYEAGASTPELAREHGVDKWTIRSAVMRAGGTMRPRGHPSLSPPDAARAYLMWQDGAAAGSIAVVLGVSRNCVSNVLTRMGVVVVARPTKVPTGRDNPNWKGVHVNAGYRSVYPEPGDEAFIGMCRSNGTILEHRLVMARALGRPLDESETVHHINGIHDDNRIENLQLRQGQHGAGVKLQCNECGSHDILAVPLD